MKKQDFPVFVKTVLFVIFAHGFLLAGAPGLLVLSGIKLIPYHTGILRFAGFFPFLFGAAFYLWCVRDFVSKGQGTPAVWDPPKEFVWEGPYAVVRNPMYLGMITVLIGEAIFFESVAIFLYAMTLWLGFHLFVVYYEEPNLTERFGKTYEGYLKAVPRWFPKRG